MVEINAFNEYHPITIMFYFISVIIVTMITMNPTILICSFLGAMFMNILCENVKKTIKKAIYGMLVVLFVGLINPVFVHEGKTVLIYVNDKAITFEAIIYGFVSGLMLVTVFIWSSSINKVMSTDKYIYLTSHFFVNIGLVLSMTFRMIPLLLRQYQKIDEAQRVVGLYAGRKKMDLIREKINVFSITISWALENAMITSDSMKARGYGKSKRTHFHLYKIKQKDIVVISIIFIYILLLVGIWRKEILNFYFYPVISTVVTTCNDILVIITTLLFMLIPTFIELKETIRWKLLDMRM